MVHMITCVCVPNVCSARRAFECLFERIKREFELTCRPTQVEKLHIPATKDGVLCGRELEYGTPVSVRLLIIKLIAFSRFITTSSDSNRLVILRYCQRFATETAQGC